MPMAIEESALLQVKLRRSRVDFSLSQTFSRKPSLSFSSPPIKPFSSPSIFHHNWSFFSSCMTTLVSMLRPCSGNKAGASSLHGSSESRSLMRRKCRRNGLRKWGGSPCRCRLKFRGDIFLFSLSLLFLSFYFFNRS